MKSKYKVGDKVEVLDCMGDGIHNGKIGKIVDFFEYRMIVKIGQSECGANKVELVIEQKI